jgi:thiol-disulfide isomerase/thioredoxin
MQLFKEASEAARGGERDKALAKLTELQTKHKGSRAAGAGSRLQAELNVVGKKVDALETEEWLIGQGTLADSKATMLVFWEVWCPHCKREVPNLQATFDKFKGDGFGMIGLTKLTRGKTKDEVMAFLEENKVSYPVAKESGSMSTFFGVSGVPAAAVVKNGEVVWRGHPAQVNEEMITSWIN